ncbi:MAG: DUF2911 domain-containing protein [Cyclobacteriaceae bacterium]|nr:DUF2911 domain-containing protein [Cyclobacteriaceae bacterium]
MVVVLGLTIADGWSQVTNHNHAPVKADTLNKKSIPLEEHAQIGDTHITILYTAPAVRGRVIWGGLVPYDEVWVTGAHRATSFEIDRELTIDSKKIPAGKYAVFTIPGKEKWIFILNRRWDQHLTDEYNQAEDVLRLEVAPRILPSVQERLNYTITELSDKEAILSISWEKVKVNVSLKLN